MESISCTHLLFYLFFCFCDLVRIILWEKWHKATNFSQCCWKKKKKNPICEVVGIAFLWERKDGSMEESFSMHITQMCSQVVLHGYLWFEDMHISPWLLVCTSGVHGTKKATGLFKKFKNSPSQWKKKAQVCMWYFWIWVNFPSFSGEILVQEYWLVRYPTRI